MISMHANILFFIIFYVESMFVLNFIVYVYGFKIAYTLAYLEQYFILYMLML